MYVRHLLKEIFASFHGDLKMWKNVIEYNFSVLICVAVLVSTAISYSFPSRPIFFCCKLTLQRVTWIEYNFSVLICVAVLVSTAISYSNSG